MRTSKPTQQNTKTKAPVFDPKPYLRSSLTESQVREVKQTFDIFDVDHVGSINPSQLKAVLREYGTQATSKSVYQLICDFEADGKGRIGFDDFLHLFTQKVSSKDSKKDLAKVFTLYNEDKTGYISIKNIRNIAKDVGAQLTQDQLQLMIKYADVDKDGFVSSDQFYRIMTKYRT